jgi:hypothetical protein
VRTALAGTVDITVIRKRIKLEESAEQAEANSVPAK